MTASLSVNTRHAYATALANFSTFRSNYALPLQWPVPETHIHAYITYLFHNGYAPSTAAMHISAISFQHKINHNFDSTSTFAISKMLEGYKRLRANPDNRMPIMYNTLVAISAFLSMKHFYLEQLTVWHFLVCSVLVSWYLHRHSNLINHCKYLMYYVPPKLGKIVYESASVRPNAIKQENHI